MRSSARSDRDRDEKKRPPKVTFARLMALARPEWKTLTWATLFLAVGSGLGLLYPQAMRLILDEALAGGDSSALNLVAGVMIGVFVLQALAIALRYVLFNTAGERVVTNLRVRLYRRLIQQEIGFFDQRRTGELISRLGSDTAVLQSAVSANISMGLRNLAQGIGALIFLGFTSPILTGLMLLVVPPVALGAVAYGRRVRKLSREVQDSLAEASEIAEESLAGIRTVRSFAAEEAEATRYGKSVNRAFELARRRIVAGGTFMAAASFASYAASVIVLWYGGRLVLNGEMSVGALASFLLYTLIVAFSFGSLSDLWADFMRAGGAAERVFELLEREPEIPTTGGIRLPRVEGGVGFDRVHFSYPSRKDVPVLRGVELAIAPGEIVAVVGSSGAGKSTLASLLGRLYDPDEGAVTVDGIDIRTLDPDWLRRQVGVVAQEPILFSATIAENIRYGRPEASDEEIEAAARAANAHDFIKGFPEGYATQVGERGVQLSGGQKQRVAIARAVLKDPRILVLDEATSALDSESEALVKEALDRLMQGRTTLIIAHRLSTVVDASRVVVLDGGVVVQSGRHQTLMHEPGLYRRLVERQFVTA